MNILVVDDHRLIVDDIIDELKQISPEIQCTGVTDPHEALGLIRKNSYDVAYLDVEMPGMNGMNLAAEILKLSPHTNLIFVTGYTEYALESYEYHASGFITKPVNRTKLRESLQHLRYRVPSITEETIRASYNGSTLIGKRLEAVREERGMTRKEMAEKMDVSVQTVYRWESGDRIPDVVTLMRLSKLLGVTMDELAG